MIDPRTGILTFEKPLVQIHSALSRADFLESTWANGAVDFVVNEPWHSWKRKGGYKSGRSSFDVVLFFEGERLDMITFSDCDSKFGTSWGDWSVENEMNRHESHYKWLAACIGNQRSFPWGSVWSGCDPKTGDAAIAIRYTYGRQP
jgi:hypothetical protein